MPVDTIYQTAISIGRDEQHNNITISIESLLRGTYVAGLQGMGKTNLLKILFRGIADAGAGGLFLDPHGDVSRELLATWPQEHIDRLIYLDASDPTHAFALNLFNPRDDSPLAKQKTVDDVVAVFKKIYGPSEWGIQIETNLRGAAQIFVDNPGTTVADLRPFLLEEGFRNPLLERATTYPDTVDFWRRFGDMSETTQKRDVASTDRRLMPLVTHLLVRHMIGQQNSTIDFRALMDERKLVIVRLAKGEIGSEGLTLLSTLCISEILRSALSRSDTTERHPFITIVDEFQTVAVNDFASLISEARKFNVGLVMANQVLEDLDADQRSTALRVINRIAFQVTSKNARQLVDEGYFMAERKPGPAVRKPKIERVYEYQPEQYWDPPTAQIECSIAEAKLAQLNTELTHLVEHGTVGQIRQRRRAISDLLGAASGGPRYASLEHVSNRIGVSFKSLSDPQLRFHRQLIDLVARDGEEVWARSEGRWDLGGKRHPIIDLRIGGRGRLLKKLPNARAPITLNLDGVLPLEQIPIYRMSSGHRDQIWETEFLNALREQVQSERPPTVTFRLPISYALGLVELKGVGLIVRVISSDAEHDQGSFADLLRDHAEYEPALFPRSYDWLCVRFAELEDQERGATAALRAAIDEAQQRVMALRGCHKTRIQEIDTGYEIAVKHYNPYSDRDETVYEWAEGDLLSLTQTKADLAQALAHLPERQCVMRLRSEDGSLWQGMVWPHHDRAPVNSEQRTRTVLERSRERYYRPRAAVEAEIKQRRRTPPVVRMDALTDALPNSVLKRRKINEV